MIRADMIILPTSVPDEVVEAAKEAYRHTDEKTMSDWLAEIIAAAINAWPDAGIEEYVNGDRGIFLPLPQKEGDA